MADHSILFSAPMVRAILREIERPGTGKTQTRRVVKPQPVSPVVRHCWYYAPVYGFTSDARVPTKQWEKARLLAREDDRLWAREAWENSIGALDEVSYRATVSDDVAGAWTADEIAAIRWRPSIHMPRWASRLTLYVTDVRVERLQDISEGDAIAEGVRRDTVGSVRSLFADQEATADLSDDMALFFAPDDDCDDALCFTAREAYARLWETINGPGAWDANPWVVAYSFVPRLGNIDSLPATFQEAA